MDDFNFQPPSSAEEQDTLKEDIYALSLSAGKLLDTLQQRAEKVDQKDIKELISVFDTVSEIHSVMDTLEKSFSALKQHLSYEVIPSVFESVGFESVKINGKLYYIGARFNASIPADKKTEAYVWLEAHQMGHLVKPSVNVKSLSSEVTDYFKEKGILPPEEIIRIHKQPYTAVRKA